MELAFNSFSVTLLVIGTVVGVLSFIIAFLLKDAIRWIALTMLSISIWGFFYGLELSTLSLDNMIFWVKFQYIGISLAPACWLFFTLKYTGYSLTEKKALVPLLLLIPIVTLFLVFTNESQKLFYETLALNNEGPFPILDIVKGPWYFINVVYAYLIFSLGVIILWKRFRFSNPLFKTQTKLIIAGGAFPIFFNFLYQTKIIAPYSGIDLTPYAFLFTYIVLGIAIIRFNLFSIKPIARDKIMEAIPKGVLVLDSENLIIDFNQAMQCFIPSNKKLKLAENGIELFAETKELLELVEEGIKETKKCEVKFGEDEKTLKIELIPLFDKGINSSGKIILFEDISSQIKINNKLASQAEDLQQLNDLKDKFFSIISHDLKGPIFGVNEVIHLANTGIISQEEFIEILPELSKNMANVSLLLENLLAWSSSQLRGELTSPENFEINKTLKYQKDLLDRIARDKEIKIIIEESAEKWVYADKTMIELVLRNIISNAVKFSKIGGEIKISTEIQEREAKICIQDFGTGMSEENLEKLKNGIAFTTKGQNNESGTGLGHILIREYLKKNKGTMEIFSKENEGTKFCILLPLHQKEMNQRPKPIELRTS